MPGAGTWSSRRPLTCTVDNTERELKLLEIAKARDPQVVQAEQAELSIMRQKIPISSQEIELLSKLGSDPGNFGLVEQLEGLQMQVDQIELQLKQQQVNTLKLRRPPPRATRWPGCKA